MHGQPALVHSCLSPALVRVADGGLMVVAVTSHPLATSTDPDVLFAAARQVARAQIRPLGRSPRAPFTHVIRGLADHDDFGMVFIVTNLGVEIAEHHPESYYVNLALEGRIRMARSDEYLTVSGAHVAVFNPGECQRQYFEADVAQALGVRLSRSLVESELSGLLHRSLQTPLRFAFGSDRRGPALHHSVRTTADLLDSADPTLASPAMRTNLMRHLATCLLLSQPHNYAEELSCADPTALRPRTLRRALDYIDEHFAEQVTLADIAEAAGYSVRTVTEAFRTHMDTTPMRHLRVVRLKEARARLTAGTASISEVAYACGFTHLGRFAEAYRRLFGELPSVTAKLG